jgi:hypothetical protein
MNIFLSKKVRLARDKQEAAQALRRQAQEARAQRQAEDDRLQSERLLAMQR